MCESQTKVLINEQITFFGAGSMAEAIIRGMTARSVVKPNWYYRHQPQ